ncbi:hypothetical protein BH09ACT8_BH09ACT8_52190 [soil metagenome]
MATNPQAEKTGPEPGKEHPPVGPTDHGGKGGMATREVAPDISEPDPEESSD